MNEKYVNGAATTLNGAINNSTTSITVTSATGFPTVAPFRILVVAEGANSNELMKVTAGAGTTSWTVTRAAEVYAGSSSASAHANGAQVISVLTVDALMATVLENVWRPLMDGNGAVITNGTTGEAVMTLTEP